MFKLLASAIALSVFLCAGAQAQMSPAEKKLGLLVASVAYIEAKCSPLRVDQTVFNRVIEETGADTSSPTVRTEAFRMIGLYNKAGPEEACMLLLLEFGPMGTAVRNMVKGR